MQVAVITVTVNAVMVNEVGFTCSGSNHSVYEINSDELSGVDALAVIKVTVNAIMLKLLGRCSGSNCSDSRYSGSNHSE